MPIDSSISTEELFIAVLVWIIAIFCVGGVAYRSGLFSLNRPPLFSPALSLISVLAAFVYFFSPVIVLQPLLFSFFHFQPAQITWFDLIVIAAGSLSLIVFNFFLSRNIRELIWGYRLREGAKGLLSSLGLGVICWALCYPVVALVNLGLQFAFPSEEEQVAVQYLKMSLESPVLFAFSVALVVLLVPIAEELLFRGFLQTWLRQKFSSRFFAIIITSFLFALFHFSTSQGMTNISLLISLFVLACFLGFLYEREQSLWASIGLHSTFNGVSILLLLSD